MKSLRHPTAIKFAFMLTIASLASAATADEHDYGKLLAVVSKSKMTLADGLKQAAAKSPEVSISGKFELDDHGALSLSIYTAEKGLGVDSEHNVLKELSGSPEGDKWQAKVEVFEDVEHVSRSAQQLTLMSLSPHTLLNILKKAEKDQAGTVFSIAPALKDRKATFVVLVANKGKVVELAYDLMTGEKK